MEKIMPDDIQLSLSWPIGKGERRVPEVLDGYWRITAHRKVGEHWKTHQQRWRWCYIERLNTYWDLMEFKPKANKIISIIELWSKTKQGSTSLNEWITRVYNMVTECNYADDRETNLQIVGCNSPRTKDNGTEIGNFYFYWNLVSRSSHN